MGLLRGTRNNLTEVRVRIRVRFRHSFRVRIRVMFRHSFTEVRVRFRNSSQGSRLTESRRPRDLNICIWDLNESPLGRIRDVDVFFALKMRISLSQHKRCAATSSLRQQQCTNTAQSH